MFAGITASQGSTQPENSPGVRLREDLSYEPLLHVGGLHDDSTGMVWFSFLALIFFTNVILLRYMFCLP